MTANQTYAAYQPAGQQMPGAFKPDAQAADTYRERGSRPTPARGRDADMATAKELRRDIDQARAGAGTSTRSGPASRSRRLNHGLRDPKMGRGCCG